SSTAAATSGNTSVAVLQASEGAYTSFDSITVAAADVLVKYTWTGDTNLDGRATFDDFNNFLAGFAGTVTPPRWFAGDFNFSGGVSFDDFQLFLTGYNAYNTSGIVL